MPSCMLAGRRSLRPARSGCWRWKGRSGQPARAPAGRQPTEHGAPSAQNAGSRSAAVAARCSGEGANGQVSRRGASPGLTSTASPRSACSGAAAAEDVTRATPAWTQMRVRRPTASSTWLFARAAVNAACGVASTARAGRLRAAIRVSRPVSRRVSAHSSSTRPRARRRWAPRRVMRSQPPGGTRISAPTAIAAPLRTGCSAIRARCVRDTATTRAGGPQSRTCARAAGAGASATNAAETAAPRRASVELTLTGPSSAPGASRRRRACPRACPRSGSSPRAAR